MSAPYYADESVTLWHGDALALPLEDATVDLVVTSPPYFGLRSYQDGGEHYAGQIGSEATPAEFVDALIAATREMVRVLKPSGSIWVNLGDKYSSRVALRPSSHQDGLQPGRPGVEKDWKASKARGEARMPYQNVTDRETGQFIPEKSLMGIPARYMIRCIDELGLILRAEVIWSKPNGLPESVTDRVRRSHETWFHFTKEPRYYSAVDEIREAHEPGTHQRRLDGQPTPKQAAGLANGTRRGYMPETYTNPLGKLPGSVWTIATQPLTVPASLGVDHFAAFPMEWPRRIITGWSPREVCTACGEGRRPVVASEGATQRSMLAESGGNARYEGAGGQGLDFAGSHNVWRTHAITGYACDCPDTAAPTTPGVVLDPFSGTGTTALMAKVLGRRAVGVDLSADYCRLAQWRVNDPGQIASAMQVDKVAPPMDDQGVLDLGESA